MIKVVNLYREPYEVYIGRAGKGQDGYFGNPHRVGHCALCGKSHTRTETIQAFRLYFWQRVATDAEYKRRVQALSGRLGCFCGAECHGNVYVEYHAYLESKRG